MAFTTLRAYSIQKYRCQVSSKYFLKLKSATGFSPAIWRLRRRNGLYSMKFVDQHDHDLSSDDSDTELWIIMIGLLDSLTDCMWDNET